MSPSPPDSAPEPKIISRFDVYLPGLNEVVTHVFYEDPTGFIHKQVLREDKTVVRPRELLEAERVAYQAAFGKMTQELARTLDSSGDDDVLKVGVVFDPQADEAKLANIRKQLRQEEVLRVEALRAGRIRSDGKNGWLAVDAAAEPIIERSRHRHQLKVQRTALLDEAVLTRRAEVVRSLREAGYAVSERSSTTPIAYVYLPAIEVRALAEREDVSWLFHAGASTGEEYDAPNGIQFHGIDTGMNASPLELTGVDQKVGLLENVKCAIHDGHDAFLAAPSTVYNDESLIAECDVDTDCIDLCKTSSLGSPGVCIEKNGVKRCVDPHLSKVASGIWASRDEPGGFTVYGAGEAAPYVWVGSSSTATEAACDPDEIQLAYDWFDQEGVKTVVESYGCNSNGADGFVDDWNAARRDVAIFRASPSTGDETYLGCRPANALCVGGMIDPYLPIDAWKNPASETGYGLDREEPDLVALAGGRVPNGVDVIDLISTDGWEPGYGTSFANPLIAGMATLVKEQCGGDVDPRFLRAMLMTASWYYDPVNISEGGLAFSTQPKPGGTVDLSRPGYIDTYNQTPTFGKGAALFRRRDVLEYRSLDAAEPRFARRQRVRDGCGGVAG